MEGTRSWALEGQSLQIRLEDLYSASQKIYVASVSHPVKIDLNKRLLPKQKTIQNFNINAQGFRKTKIENPPTWQIEFTS